MNEEIDYSKLFGETGSQELETSDKKYFLKNPIGFVNFIIKNKTTPGRYIKEDKRKLQIEHVVKNLNTIQRKKQVNEAKKANLSKLKELFYK